MCIYFPWFNYLERHVTTRFHVIHTAMDDKIPFLEIFIVPYYLWFLYVAGAVMYFLFKNKEEYYRLCIFLFVGMTVFLIASTVYPNGHYLRPGSFERDNIFTAMVAHLYQIDTPTNLSLWHCENFKKNKALRFGSSILMVSIILSTMFLKQHSVFDVITGIACAACMYTLVYTKNGLRVGDSQTSLEEWVRHV